MARVCELCGKTPLKGHKVSHSAQKSIRRFKPNLRTVRIEVNGKMRKMRICAKCLKSRRVVVTEEV